MNSPTTEAYTQELYSAEEMRRLNLPGFQSESTLWDMAAADTDWQHILSLSIYSRDLGIPDRINVLTGIRPEDSPTHGNVASTPTSRFAGDFARPLLGSKSSFLLDMPPIRLEDINPAVFQIAAGYAPNRQFVPNRTTPFVALAHEPLLRKLEIPGLAFRHTEFSQPLGSLSLVKVVAGFSYAAHDDATDTPLWEPLLMYGGALMLDDPQVIPENTNSYQYVSWTDVAEFRRGVAERDVETVVPATKHGAAATFCARGLCLTMTDLVSRDPALYEHLGIV